VRNRLLRRALSFKPQATVANGDHVYWDLLSPNTSKGYGASAEAKAIAGTFDRAGIVLGGDNETVLKRAAGPQIVPVYGADFRSTPVFFLQDDHDYFDNDDATDAIVTFPPSHRWTPPVCQALSRRWREGKDCSHRSGLCMRRFRLGP
jgi:hypothetical protein